MQKEVIELYKKLGKKYNLPDYVIEEIIKIPFKRLKESTTNRKYEILHLMFFGKFAPKGKYMQEKIKYDKNNSETVSDGRYKE